MLFNPFNQDAFTLVNLAEAMTILPNNYGRINQSGIFKEKGSNSRTILVEMKDGVLNLLPTKPVGAPGSELNRGLRNVRSLVIPHIPAHDVILPQELEGIRAFGTEDRLIALSEIMAEHLQSAKDKFAITKEYQRITALNGSVLDSDGATVLFNWYEEFLMKQKTVTFTVSGTEDPRKPVLELKRYMETHLKGETMNGYHCYVDKDFFDGITQYGEMKTAWDRWREGEFYRSDMRNRFEFCGIVFEEYEGTADDRDGVARKFIPSKYGYCYPTGTSQMFRSYYAPANRFSTINKPGQENYVWQRMRDDESGIDLWFETNPMHMVMRPELIVKVYCQT